MTDDPYKARKKGGRGRPFGDDNPPPQRGRPKGARNFKTIAKEIAHKRHKVVIEGRARRLTTVELVLFMLRKLALEGHHRAIVERDRIIARYSPSEAQGGLLVVPATASEEQWTRLIDVFNRSVVQPDPMGAE